MHLVFTVWLNNICSPPSEFECEHSRHRLFHPSSHHVEACRWVCRAPLPFSSAKVETNTRFKFGNVAMYTCKSQLLRILYSASAPNASLASYSTQSMLLSGASAPNASLTSDNIWLSAQLIRIIIIFHLEINDIFLPGYEGNLAYLKATC